MLFIYLCVFLSIIRMQYNSKSIFWKRIHTVWSNTACCLSRFLNVNSKLLLIQNHLLLIFKIYIFNSRRSESLKIKSLIREITKVKNIEENILLNNEKKTCYIQDKMATSWKCFEDQNFLKFYLIQPLSRGGREWFKTGE